jgi:hypothetical protein
MTLSTYTLKVIVKDYAQCSPEDITFFEIEVSHYEILQEFRVTNHELADITQFDNQHYYITGIANPRE